MTGQFTACLKRGNRQSQQEVYVVEGLNKPLLGRPAIEGLAPVSAVKEEPSPFEEFPLLFKGLGKLEGEYTISLKEELNPLLLPPLIGLPYLY